MPEPALIPCPACKATQIHPEASACPRCGNPYPRGKPKFPIKRWERILAIIIAVATLVSFVYKDGVDRKLTRRIATLGSLRASQEALDRHEELLTNQRETWGLLRSLDPRFTPANPGSAAHAALLYELQQIQGAQVERDRYRILAGKMQRITIALEAIDADSTLDHGRLVSAQMQAAEDTIDNVMTEYGALIGSGIAPARLSQAEADSLVVLLEQVRASRPQFSGQQLEYRVADLENTMTHDLTRMIKELSRRADVGAWIIYGLGFVVAAGGLLGKFLG